jgi:hypothetical protein
LPAGVLALLYGKEASGKSFLALDFGLSVAAGMDWHGRKVKQGPVVYVAAEGNTGIYARAEAWSEAHGVELGGLPFYVITQPVDMKTVTELVRDIRAVCPNAVQITIDTLARNFGGMDENSTKDMSAFVHRVDELRAAFPGATVLVVHHSGKDQSRGDRGSTALRGAVDTSLWLDRTEKADKRTDRLTLRCKKQKDGREFDPIPLRLAAVDEDEGSCVIEPRVAVGAEEDWPSSSPKTARTDQKALEALKGFAGADVSFTAWWKASGLAKSTFNGAIKRLAGG